MTSDDVGEQWAAALRPLQHHPLPRGGQTGFKGVYKDSGASGISARYRPSMGSEIYIPGGLSSHGGRGL